MRQEDDRIAPAFKGGRCGGGGGGVVLTLADVLGTTSGIKMT